MLLSKAASKQVLAVFDLAFRVRNCSEEILDVSIPEKNVFTQMRICRALLSFATFSKFHHLVLQNTHPV